MRRLDFTGKRSTALTLILRRRRMPFLKFDQFGNPVTEPEVFQLGSEEAITHVSAIKFDFVDEFCREK